MQYHGRHPEAAEKRNRTSVWKRRDGERDLRRKRRLEARATVDDPGEPGSGPQLVAPVALARHRQVELRGGEPALAGGGAPGGGGGPPPPPPPPTETRAPPHAPRPQRGPP